MITDINNIISVDNAASCFTSQRFTEEVLSEKEKEHIGKYSRKRISDFATGRYCAKQTLSLLGYGYPEIQMGVDNEPLWPKGIVGSISHSENLTGAIAGHTENFYSIGMDIETMGKVGHDAWHLVFTENEQDFLNSLSEKDAVYYSTILFSMKECFYKFQFPLKRTFLEFKDVEIFRNGMNFELKVLRNPSVMNLISESLTMYYAKTSSEIITYCYLHK